MQEIVKLMLLVQLKIIQQTHQQILNQPIVRILKMVAVYTVHGK
jgi:hypothetical protein